VVEKWEEAMLRKIDCIMLRVDDLEAAIAYYQDILGLRLHWRQPLQAGLGLPETDAEIVLYCDPNIPREASVHYLVDDVISTVRHLAAEGCTIQVEPFEIAIGQCAAVTDPFGNTLYLLDMTKGPLPAGYGLSTENATERPNQHE
jgi:catechol 2,3-dioxygenase-like lactoylglutathione lyase family enzyme